APRGRARHDPAGGPAEVRQAAPRRPGVPLPRPARLRARRPANVRESLLTVRMLPIREVLPELLAALDRPGSAVLTAPPGTGKTTVVPLALAEAGMRVLVAEPRRLAARAAARRMGVSDTNRRH